jgi:YggT family protein
MLNPFIDLVATVIHLYLWCVIVWAVVSTLISFKVINSYQPLVQRIMITLDRLVEPALRPIRKYMPDLGGIDLSPIVLILLLNFTNSALYTYFYNL